MLTSDFIRSFVHSFIHSFHSLGMLEEHSKNSRNNLPPVARDLQILLVFFQHPAWFIKKSNRNLPAANFIFMFVGDKNFVAIWVPEESQENCDKLSEQINRLQICE